jgi:hypothetical protein
MTAKKHFEKFDAHALHHKSAIRWFRYNRNTTPFDTINVNVLRWRKSFQSVTQKVYTYICTGNFGH